MIWLAALAIVIQELCALNATVFIRSQEYLIVGRGHFNTCFSMWQVT